MYKTPRGVRYEDAAWQSLKLRLAEVDALRVNCGVLASKGGTANHSQGNSITIIELAAIHEFGSPAANIPERSFIRRAFSVQASGLVSMQTRLAKALVLGRMTGYQAMSLLGQWGQNAIKRTITGEHIPPPLQPATIARKGSDRPLVDTGRLLGAISYEVTTG